LILAEIESYKGKWKKKKKKGASGSGERIIIESSSFRTTHTKKPATVTQVISEPMIDT
jgi:hypothetical protein